MSKSKCQAERSVAYWKAWYRESRLPCFYQRARERRHLKRARRRAQRRVDAVEQADFDTNEIRYDWWAEREKIGIDSEE